MLMVRGTRTLHGLLPQPVTSTSGAGSTPAVTQRRLGPVDRTELRGWIEDALARHDRDARERDETVANVTADEIIQGWGQLPLNVRRRTTPAQVQASLTMLTLRRGIVLGRDDADPADAVPGIES